LCALVPSLSPRVGYAVITDPLCLLVGCRKRRLNQAPLNLCSLILLAMMDWSKRGNINTAALVTIVKYNTLVARCSRQLIGPADWVFVTLGPLAVISLEANAYSSYCSTVEWFWWDLSLFQWPTGFLQCFDTVGWVVWPVKIVCEMTYKVSSGTLSFYTLTLFILFALFCMSIFASYFPNVA